MRYSRTGVIAVLIALEVFLAGGILSLLGVGGWHAGAAGLHSIDTASRGTSVFDAGDAPHVVIDDPDSRIVITPSSDGKVHVSDDTRIAGLVWGGGSAAALRTVRTPDGVAVTRLNSGRMPVSILGYSSERVLVALPPASVVEITGCSGADLNGLQGRSLALRCGEGSLHLQNIAVASGTLWTGDGSIRLGLTGQNLVVHAKTADGSLHVNGSRVSGEDSSETTFQIGTGGGRLEVATGDGSIHITHNGAQ